jgi:hypothetical protein
VADDVVALDGYAADDPLMLPGVPQLKLWPDVAAFLGHEPETLRCIHPELEKRAHPVDHNFAEVLWPLRSIYVLADDPTLVCAAFSGCGGRYRYPLSAVRQTGPFHPRTSLDQAVFAISAARCGAFGGGDRCL